ncbi:MAG: tRNA 2-thiocytidine biosynthesis protein TtcA [Chlamydiae bacterium]|nr:tRNA 2-thiocytidine biosynthesis protein TtcA [Chlamydiota bacterium]
MELPIVKHPFSTLGKKIERLCRKACYDFELLQDIDKLAIALSGGKDSLTLLYLMKAIVGRGFPNMELFAIHVEGSFSCGPSLHQNFLSSICKELDIKLVVKKVDIKQEALECYSCSRQRRTIIFNAAKECGIHTVAFGHHLDDNNQTLLMNLFHKAEFASLMPKIKMIDYDVTIIRPLIYVEEKDIINFAKQNNFARITCQCPLGQNSKRKITNQLIDEIEKEYPHVRKNLSKAGLIYGSKKALNK